MACAGGLWNSKADYACGISHNNGAGRNIFRDNRTGPEDAAGSDGDSGKDNNAGADPDVVANLHWRDGSIPLLIHWDVGSRCTVVGTVNQNFRPHHYVVSYPGAFMNYAFVADAGVRAD